MLLTIGVADRINERNALRAIFEARKQVFVDLLKWDIPVLDGRFEIDQFDDADAVYLVVMEEGQHCASARLLPTTRPTLLENLFPTLCDGPVPKGETIWEISRFCLSPRTDAAQRRRHRNALVSGLVRHARTAGITAYTGVAELAWYEQIAGLGWSTRRLGTGGIGGRTLVALRIEIDENSMAGLEAAGVYAPAETDAALDRAA